MINKRNIDFAEPLKRSFDLDVRSVDEEKRTVELSFSSNAEIERYFGIEILDHSAGSVRLDRLQNGAPLLVNHDTRDQVGVVESVRIDDNAVGRAVVRFSRSQRGEEIFNDVKDGIRRLVSVGYRVLKWEETEDGNNVTVRATLWEPHELSIVPIPADISVGVGRSESPLEAKAMTVKTEETTATETRAADVAAPVQPSIDVQAERSKATKAERERANQIRKLADDFDVGDLGTRAVEEEWSVAKFREETLNEVGRRNNQLRVEKRADDNLSLDSKDAEKFSFSRLMHALANPNDNSAQKRAGYEFEMQEAALQRMPADFKARGAYVPSEVVYGVRDLSVGTATAGGNLVGTSLLGGSFIELLRNAMATAAAGVRTMPGLVGNVDIPRQTGGSSMAWLSAEDAEAGESDPTFDQVVLTPKDAAVFTEVTRRLTQQSTPAIEGLVRSDIAQAIGIGTDAAILYGSGAAGQPTGIVNATGVNAPTNFAAAAPTWAELIAMIQAVMTDNALSGALSWMIDPTGWAAVNTTEKAANTAKFLMDEMGKIAGYGAHTSNQMTAGDFIFGDFSQVIVGEWGGLELNVDPYTNALRGRTRFIAFKTMDVAIRHPEAFAFNNDGA